MPTTVDADLANAAHADAVVRLLDDYARDPMGGGAGLSAQTRAHLIDALRQRPAVHVVLAFAGDEAVGLAICVEGFSTFACQPLLNIHDIAVTPAWRGKGIGSAMLRHVEALARRLGCCKLTLEVLEGNLPAQAAYRAAGFDGYTLDPAMGSALFWQKKLAGR